MFKRDYSNINENECRLRTVTVTTCFFLPPTPLKIINYLDANKSTGPNSIPVFILKILKPFFSFWLTLLINLSFEVSIFPDLKTE